MLNLAGTFWTDQLLTRLGPRQVCLTFDDGPGDPQKGQTLAIAEFLHREGISATFFVVGQRIEQPGGRETLYRLRQLGHTIGNHTFSHPDLPTLVQSGPEKVAREFVDTHHLIRDFVHDQPLMFRPPFGTWDESVAMAMNSVLELNHYHGPFCWHVECQDWSLGKKVDGEIWTIEHSQDRFQSQLQPHQRGLILLHDCLADKIQTEGNYRRDALGFELTKRIVGWLRQEQYKFTSLDLLIGEETS